MMKPERINDTLIDTSSGRFSENEGLRQWAELQNLKITASIYAELNRMGIKTFNDLDQRINELHDRAKACRKDVISLDKEIKAFSEIVRFGKQYEENKRYAFRYEKSKDPERYYKDHRDQLALAWGATDVLKNARIDPDSMDLKEIEKHLDELKQRRKKAANLRSRSEHETETLKNYKEALITFMDDKSPIKKTHKQERDHSLENDSRAK